MLQLCGVVPRALSSGCLACATAGAAPGSAAAAFFSAAAQQHQQLPGTYRLLQVLRGCTMQQQQQQRGIAQAAQQEVLPDDPHQQHQQQPQPHLQQSAASQPLPAAPTAAADMPGARQAAAAAALAAAQQQPLYTPPSGVKKTFYKRKLPCPPATEFSSEAGRMLFAEALAAGTMSGFFKLIEQYSTQDEPAFCGLASIAMVLNALSIDPKRPWKGSWRWWHEQLLDCCLPLNKVAQEGVALTQAACLAKCNGANVTLHRAGSFSLEQFRADVVDTCSSGDEHLVVSYTRKAFGQTGDGHFSPVGGYHAGKDLVLILDTARFKYPPHWVPLPMLFEAMKALDPTTGLPRGYLRLSANAAPDSVLFTLDLRPDGSWRAAEHFIKVTAPALVRSAAAEGTAAPLEALLARLVAVAPLGSVTSFIAMRYAAASCARDRCVPHTVRQQVLQELAATPLHQALQPLLQQHQPQQQQQQVVDAAAAAEGADDGGCLSEKLTMLLLLQEPGAWGGDADWADPEQRRGWQQLVDASAVSILEGEVGYLRQQLRHIDDVMQVNGSGISGGPGAFSASCVSCGGGEAAAAPAAAGGSLPHQHGCGTAQLSPAATAAAAGTGGAPRGLATLAGAAAAGGSGGGRPRSPCATCDFRDGCHLQDSLDEATGAVVIPNRSSLVSPASAAAAARGHTGGGVELVGTDCGGGDGGGHGCCS